MLTKNGFIFKDINFILKINFFINLDLNIFDQESSNLQTIIKFNSIIYMFDNYQMIYSNYINFRSVKKLIKITAINNLAIVDYYKQNLDDCIHKVKDS